MDKAALKDLATTDLVNKLSEEELEQLYWRVLGRIEKSYKAKLVKWVSVGAFAGFALGILTGMGIMVVNG